MPILYRQGTDPSVPSNVPLDWDDNRVDVSKNDKLKDAVCTFVSKSDLKQSSTGDTFELTTSTTLADEMRAAVLVEADRKQDELMQMFEFESEREEQEARRSLSAISGWPTRNIEVKANVEERTD